MVEQRIPTGVLVLIAVTIAVGAVVAAINLSLVGPPTLSAAEPDNHGVCSDADPEDVGIMGSADSVTHSVGEGVITGFCLKAGNTEEHTFFDQNVVGDCYTITGIGDVSVTVERTGEKGPDCQAISHIDVITGPAPTATPTPTATATAPAGATPTATPMSTPTGQVLGVTALPDTGQPPGGSSNWVLPLLALGGLLLLGGAGTVAVVKVRRGR